LLLEQSIGVQRGVWYSYDSSDWGNLWTAAGGLTAAGVAYQQVEKWITGTTLSAPCAQPIDDATTFVCGYTRAARKRGGGECDCDENQTGGADARASGYQAQAVWNTAGTKAFAVDAQYTQYRDVSGTTHAVSGGTVTISTTPILLETGTVKRQGGPR
jgi:hypothetical protein